MLTVEQIRNFEINPMIQLCYDYILPIREDRVLATHGGQIYLITNNGEMLCYYDSIEVPSFNDFNNLKPSENGNAYIAENKYIDDYLLVYDSGLWGLMDYDGNILVHPKYRILKFIDVGYLECLE